MGLARVLACPLVVAALVAGRADAAAPRPNLIVIVADDLGYADLGCYGNRFVETPRLDRLAAEGITFTRYYTAGSACMTTRVGLFSGKYPLRLYRWTRTGVAEPEDAFPWDPLPLEEVTFAETLRAAGYRTGYIGKWHLGDEAHYPDKQGFEWMAASGKYWTLPCFFHPYRVEQLDPGPDRGYLTQVLTEEAEGFLDRQRPGEPFLLFISHYAPHIPIQGEPGKVAKYEKKAAAQGGASPCVPAYAAMVEALDDSVARILAKVEARGMADRTVVVFTSDNGGFLGYGTKEERERKAREEAKQGRKKKKKDGPRVPDPCEIEYPVITSNTPLRDGKATMYEGGLRVPLLVRWPGAVKPGTSTAVPVITMDLYATFLAMAGVAPDPAQPLDGVSLVPLLREGRAPARDALYFQFGPAVVIRGTQKLIEFFGDAPRVELYDLATDPGERRDLAAMKPDLAAELRAMLHRWWMATYPFPRLKSAG